MSTDLDTTQGAPPESPDTGSPDVESPDIESPDAKSSEDVESEVDRLADLISNEAFSKAFDLAVQKKIEIFLKSDDLKSDVEVNKPFELLYNRKKETDEEEEEKKYPEDCYTFIARGPGNGRGKAFSLGITVFLFQVSLLVLMLLSKCWKQMSQNEDVDNPDQEKKEDIFANFLHSNASILVRITQVVSTLAFFIFGGESLSDFSTAWLLFPGRSEKDSKWPIFACILRGLQGLLGCATAILLVMTSTDVIDIVLNFTAVHFISSFDNMAYELAKDGFYGVSLQNATEVPELPESCQRETAGKTGIYRLSVGLLAVICIVCLLVLVIFGEDDMTWATGLFRVEFDDSTGLEKYSGCYQFDGDTHDRRFQYKRLTPTYEFNKQVTYAARAEYCKNQRKWIFHTDLSADDPCEVKPDDKIAMSSQTLTFDISTSFESGWVSAGNKPLEMYFLENDENTRERKELACDLKVGDGQCDQPLNILEYGYDGGDCCPKELIGEVTVPEGQKTIQKFVIDKMGKEFEADDGNYACKQDILSLSTKGLTGDIPTEIGKFTALTTLSFYHNELSGKIPTEIGDMKSLRVIYLAKNTLSEVIPKEIGRLTNLITLSIWENQLKGTIPTEIGLLTNLKILYMSNNMLTGPIPSEIGLLTNLEELSLWDNELKGTIPTEIGNLKKLRKLYLYENNLTGQVPCEVKLLIDENPQKLKLSRDLLNKNEFVQNNGADLGYPACA